VRDYYRRHIPLRDSVRNSLDLNLGGGWVSGLCHEPRVALAVLHQMLAWAQTAGRLLILHHHEPIAADVVADTIRQVTARDKLTGEQRHIQADY
jgi:hypothetical protein